MSKIYKKLDIAFVVFIFGIFYVYLLQQFSKVFVYYDDYGYLSLSYGNIVENVNGPSYTFKQLLQFLKGNYWVANGRLLCVFGYLLIYMIGGLQLVQKFMATSVFVIFLLLYYIACHFSKRESNHIKNRSVAAVFICLLYGLINVAIQRFGTYWYAASFMYVVPVIPFLLMATLYYKIIWQEEKKIYKILCAVCTLIAAFSQEQWIVAVICFILTVNVCKYMSGKHIKKFDALEIGLAIIGALPILTSPAAYARMENNTAFVQQSFGIRIVNNIRIIMGIFFSKDNSMYITCLLIIMFIIGIYMIKNEEGFKWLNTIFVAYTLLMEILLYVEISVISAVNIESSIASVILSFAYVIIMSIEIVILLYQKCNFCQLGIYVASFFSLACLVIVPELPYRILLPYMYLSFGLFTYVLLIIMKDSVGVWIGLAVIVCTEKNSIYNLKNTYDGYAKNYEVHLYNDEEIRKSVEEIKNGEEITKINLYKVPDILYGGEMVYVEGFEFMKNYMDEYYDLPAEVQLIYEEMEQ